MRFNEREVKRIATTAGLGEKAVLRLAGSIKVSVLRESAPSAVPERAEDGMSLELGLILNRLDDGTGRGVGPYAEHCVAKALREYMRCCPQVVGWVGRGDFDPKRLPDFATRAILLHACRTAGRLRSKVVRELSRPATTV